MPDFKPHIRPRLASLRLSPSREAEIAEELAQHLDDRWRELVARGMTPDEATHTASTEFDSARLEALLGTLRQAHWRETPPPGPSRAFSVDSVLIDLRYAIRALRATPSFTIGALLVLALGTGATTAIFSVADAVALRPLPFPESDRIVAVGVRADPVVGGGAGPQRSGPAPLWRDGAMPGAKPPDPDALRSITTQDYLDWSDQQQVFEAMATLGGVGDYVFPGAEPELVRGDRVTASFFDVLRVRPMLGTVFTSRDAVAASDRGVVVSHAFWQRHLGRDPGRRTHARAQWRVLQGRRRDAGGLRLSTRIAPASRSLDVVGAASGEPRPRRRWSSLIGRAPEHRAPATGCITRPGAGAAVPGRRHDRRRQSDHQHGARHWRSPASRSPGGQLHPGVDAHAPCRGGHRAADRVRERREPMARPGVGAATRCSRTGGTRRQPAVDSSSAC